MLVFVVYFSQILEAARRMNELGKVLNLPTIVTEQYPKGINDIYIFYNYHFTLLLLSMLLTLQKISGNCFGEFLSFS